MNQDRPAATEPQRLSDLLTSALPGLSSRTAESTSSAIWTDDALADARAASTTRRLAHGWTAGTSAGLLENGSGRAKVEMRQTALMPSRHGEEDYNPQQDAFALRLGADFEGPNRYRLGRLPLDANGACRDEDECSECGSTAMRYGNDGKVVAGGEYRFTVPDGKGGWTYCRLCVTEQEIGDIRQAKAAAQSQTRGGRRA